MRDSKYFTSFLTSMIYIIVILIIKMKELKKSRVK